MNNLVTKLSSVAALLGVVGAIGAGFVQYGKLTAKIDELDKREAVINESVDLDPINEKISNLEVDIIDRIEKVDSKIVSVDLSGIKEDITELKKEVAIVAKENELQDVLIEEVKKSTSNPLGG